MYYRIYFTNDKNHINQELINITSQYLRIRKYKKIGKDSMDTPYIKMYQESDYEAIIALNDFYNFIVDKSKSKYILKLENEEGLIIGYKLTYKKRSNSCCFT